MNGYEILAIHKLELDWSRLMGYRSEVAIKVYGDAVSMDRVKTAYCEAIKKLDAETKENVLYTMNSAKKFELGDDDIFTFHADYVKWYTDEPYIKFIEDFISRVGNYGASAEFLRIGEEDDDIETRYYGDNVDYLLSVHREIDGI